jgi:hypothetical protein
VLSFSTVFRDNSGVYMLTLSKIHITHKCNTAFSRGLIFLSAFGDYLGVFPIKNRSPFFLR